jgi:hypothetical protein
MWIRGYPRGTVAVLRVLGGITCSPFGLPQTRKVLWLASKISVLPSLKVGFFSASSVLLSACDSIQGYPQDPENSSAVIASLSSYFDPSGDVDYTRSTNPDERRRYRDLIVLSHMRAYDIEFDNFERALYGQGNSIAVAGSLATITMAPSAGLLARR